jgi:virulence-associated protein VapD
VYAIAFDLDTETLQRAYGAPSWRHAYTEIRTIHADEGFAWQQGSVNFVRPDRVDAVACVLAIQRLTRESKKTTTSAQPSTPPHCHPELVEGCAAPRASTLSSSKRRRAVTVMSAKHLRSPSTSSGLHRAGAIFSGCRPSTSSG